MRPQIACLGVAVLVLAGCTPDSPEIVQQVDFGEVAPVAVDRGPIVTVLAVDATVVATPEYVVPAARDGRVFQVKLPDGVEVARGSVVAFQDGTELTAPVTSFFVEWLVPNQVTVHAGVPIATLRYVGFGVTGMVPVVEAYRLYDGPTTARVQIVGGPGPTECQPLPVAGEAPSAPPPDALPGPPSLMVLCVLPAGVRVHPGAPAVLGLTTAERTDVLRLPVQAVAGSDGRGTVTRVVDGEVELVEVVLGVSDGVYVEIVEGLAEGDEVYPYGPHLRPPIING